MVQWSDAERKIIIDTFGSLNFKEFGGKALARCLIVYPWTQRYFGSFGSLSSPKAIRQNGSVQNHGETVMKGLDKAVNDLDNIKGVLSELSKLHSERLHVDPDNFKLLADCITIVLAAQKGNAFTPEIQAIIQKFLAVVVAALGKQYY
ncbi:hemoglobin subunit beta-1-like [Cynoglossus semilaevis]|uniref:hemoglobin subunit beta-1-like n=1 Tax=Cynoglossus semilaevis TaxID=244447 RepID=UPI0004983B11|nr:hemoglobin subunit beta-1-like [Cynoglossus semilaevis]